MDALTLRVNLDCLRKDSQAIINAKVGEANGRKVVFTLYEGRTAFFVPAGASVIFRAQKPDGTILYNNCVIDDGKVEYTITSQTVAVAGVYACELQIVSDGRIIYSPYVTLNVMDNLYADTEVESSNEFTELENALNRIPSLEVIYSKQDKLIAGENITIAEDGKTISATGGGSASIAMRVDGGYIQYSTDNGKTWVNLIAEADLKGGKGDKGDKGDKGADGAPGVYYGTTQPTGDTHPVWIDPGGDHDDGGLLPAVTAADNGKVLRVVSGAWGPADMPTGGTDMGITGATVGQIAKITAVDDTGKPTAWSPVDIPDKLPNPNAITFTGAVTGSYDGSAPLSVEIPQGGGGGGGDDGAKEFRLVRSITLEEQSDRVDISVDSSGNAFALHEVYVMIAAQSYEDAYNEVNFLPNGRWGSGDAFIASANKASKSSETWKNNMVFHSVYADGVICSEQLPAKGENKNLLSKFAINQAIITKISLVCKFAAGCTFLVIGR